MFCSDISPKINYMKAKKIEFYMHGTEMIRARNNNSLEEDWGG